jgi:hypothetical protein
MALIVMIHALRFFATKRSLFTLSALALLAISGSSVRADQLVSVLPNGPFDCPIGDHFEMFTGTYGDWYCAGNSFTQSRNILAVNTLLYGPEPWEDITATFVFDLSHLTFDPDTTGPGPLAAISATSSITAATYPFPPYFYETLNITETLFVGGVPFPDTSSSTTVPEPASVALIALPVLGMAFFRRRMKQTFVTRVPSPDRRKKTSGRLGESGFSFRYVRIEQLPPQNGGAEITSIE